MAAARLAHADTSRRRTLGIRRWASSQARAPSCPSSTNITSTCWKAAVYHLEAGGGPGRGGEGPGRMHIWHRPTPSQPRAPVLVVAAGQAQPVSLHALVAGAADPAAGAGRHVEHPAVRVGRLHGRSAKSRRPPSHGARHVHAVRSSDCRPSKLTGGLGMANEAQERRTPV